MMKTLIVFSFFIMNSVSAEVSDWHKPYCQNCEVKSSIENTIPAHLVELGELMKQGEVLEKKIDKQFDHWTDFVRWLNKRPTNKPVTKEFDSRWKDLTEEAEAVVEVNRELGAAKRKFNACLNNCSASRKVELQDNMEYLEKLRLSLSSLSPWWVSEEFKSLTDKASDKYEFVLDQETLKKTFTASMARFFQDAFKVREDIQVMRAKIDDSLKNKKNSIEYNDLVDNFVQHHGNTLDLLLRKSIVSGNKNLCQLANVKYQADKTQDTAKTGLKYSLTALSFFAGPEGIIASAAISAQLWNERAQVEKKCRSDLAVNKLELFNVSAWEDCLKVEEVARIKALLNSVSSVTTIAVPKVLQLMMRMERLPSPAITVITKPNGKTLSILDLSEARTLIQRGFNEVSGRYWKFVGDVYKKRLNLSEEEIESFIKSSILYEKRTKLITQSKGNAANGELEGGVALVESRKASEPLPLETATGEKLPRPKGKKIAEVVRLTNESDEKGLMTELLTELSKLTRQDPDLEIMYVYTSKVHLRLYRQLKIPFKEIGKKHDRDVILEFTRKEFEDSMAKLSSKAS